MTFIRPLVFATLFLGAAALAHGDDFDEIGPAPQGDAKRVSTAAIDASRHPCGEVVHARRLPDGSIKALCSNREDYRILSAGGHPIAMRCSAARKQGVEGC